jgi:hypothetical protein
MIVIMPDKLWPALTHNDRPLLIITITTRLNGAAQRFNQEEML